MRLTTHLFALIVVFSAFSLIGCSNKNDTPQQVKAAYDAGVRCGASTDPTCRNAWMAQNGFSQAQINMVNGQLGANTNLASNLPPAVAPVTNTGTGTAPQVIVSAKRDQDQAARIRQAISDISNNPNSSYYVDPNAQDVPARPSAEQVAAVNAIRSAIRAPASVQGNTADSNSTQ